MCLQLETHSYDDTEILMKKKLSRFEEQGCSLSYNREFAIRVFDIRGTTIHYLDLNALIIYHMGTHEKHSMFSVRNPNRSNPGSSHYPWGHLDN